MMSYSSALTFSWTFFLVLKVGFLERTVVFFTANVISLSRLACLSWINFFFASVIASYASCLSLVLCSFLFRLRSFSFFLREFWLFTTSW